MTRKSICPVGVLSSPLEIRGCLGAAADITRTNPDNSPCNPTRHVMGKNELVSGITVLKGLLEPVVLLCAQGPAPLVTGDGVIRSFAGSRSIGQVHRVLERVNDHEQRIAPFPGIVVLAVLVPVGCLIDPCKRIRVPE